MVPYPDLIAGFPCAADLGGFAKVINFLLQQFSIIFSAIWPRQQVGSFVAQRLSPRGALPAGMGNHAPNKKTRRRVASMAQRRAANIRERRRMFNLNEAFDKLRRKVILYFFPPSNIFHSFFPFTKGSDICLRKTIVPH
jgi:hypothetical protein